VKLAALRCNERWRGETEPERSLGKEETLG
jgi:hypothetical protein